MHLITKYDYSKNIGRMMLRTQLLPVQDLAIDLNNYRTVAQKGELEAAKAMISISPDYFWGLMESLLEDGYLPTENIIVLESSSGIMNVKEGNRRVASLKIMFGLIEQNELALPLQIVNRISVLSSEWLKDNASVPCTIYKESEADVVDRIVAHTHGKGSKAGRDVWEAVARARHNRDKNGASEIALDLLEKYLEDGTNLTQEQKTRWAGRYNLTVLDEAIKKIALRFGVTSSPELVRQYPRIQFKSSLDDIVHAIGMESLTFPAIRGSLDFALRFGVPPLAAATGENASNNNAGGDGENASTQVVGSETGAQNKNGGKKSNSADINNGAKGTSADEITSNSKQSSAMATTDERSVRKSLRGLRLFGQNRAKVETLRKEMLKLKLQDNPIAFCFLLRSMFEISAKAYCQDHISESNAPTATKNDGNDKILADVLGEIVKHLTQNNNDKQMVRLLHGPLTEIQRKDDILSVTSMNQLVHNPSFTILPGDIPTLFSNIFPLLEKMNS